jgi:hypothetical protein
LLWGSFPSGLHLHPHTSLMPEEQKMQGLSQLKVNKSCTFPAVVFPVIQHRMALMWRAHKAYRKLNKSSPLKLESYKRKRISAFGRKSKWTREKMTWQWKEGDSEGDTGCAGGRRVVRELGTGCWVNWFAQMKGSWLFFWCYSCLIACIDCHGLYEIFFLWIWYLSKHGKYKLLKSCGYYWTDIYTPIFIAALFVTAKSCKQPKCPLFEGWLDKTRFICIII